MTLKELQQKNQYSTDKESTHHYLGVYDELFAKFKNKEINIIEIGYATGGSIKLWEDYFEKAFIYCADIDLSAYKNTNHTDRVKVDKIDINEVTYVDFPVDIAIDDGSHLVKDQIAFIKLLWPAMNKGGLMIIEDVFDIEGSKKDFDALNIPYKIVDLREESGYPDSVLLIFRK